MVKIHSPQIEQAVTKQEKQQTTERGSNLI